LDYWTIGLLDYWTMSIPIFARRWRRLRPWSVTDHTHPNPRSHGQHMLHRLVINFIHFAHARHIGPFRLK
jgi:hypothetical protein